MKAQAIACILSIIAIHGASGLECGACSSSTSWEDCNTKKIECPPTDDQCIKVHWKVGEHELYHKDCSSKLECEKEKNSICKEGAGSDVICDISCCNDKDNCNAGSSFCVSGRLLLACVLASLLGLVSCSCAA